MEQVSPKRTNDEETALIEMGIETRQGSPFL